MSDQVEIEQKISPSGVDSVAVSTNADESSKVDDKQNDGKLDVSVTAENEPAEKPCSDQPIVTENSIDESKVEPIAETMELHGNPAVEMELTNKESAPDDHEQSANEEKETPINDAVISNDSVCIDIAEKNDNSVEAQKSAVQTNAVTINVEAMQPKPYTAPTSSIGSLGLLNQYASSSDEDEDSCESSDDSESCSSSSSSESADSDTETESEDEESIAVDNNVEMPPAPSVATESQLNTMANDVLAGVMSRSNYRDASSDTSDTDSDDSDIECIGSVPAPSIDITNDDEIQEFLDSCEAGTAPGPVKAKGEFTIDDLPPIDELTITVPESECVELGKVSGIVGTLVLVESLPNFAAVDIDTVLFLDKGNRTLGQVFDVMGNVASPIYCVRFNSVQDITAKDIKTGVQVYVAPQTEYTNFIVLSDLMKQKGCDASWENDHEAPDGIEFSDDEEERLARRSHNQRQHNRNRTTSTSNEQIPTKVVKSEKNTPPKMPHNNRRPKYEHRVANANKPPTRFYKDNRGYANANPESNLYQHQQQQFQHPNHFHHRQHHQQQQQMQMQQQHQMQAMHHSWHTAAAAAAAGMPSTSSVNSSTMPFTPPPYANGSNATIYPNPFALQAMNSGPFNLQAFPPLPPPMSQLPPPPPQQQQHYHHHHQPGGGRFNRKNGNNSYQNHQ